MVAPHYLLDTVTTQDEDLDRHQGSGNLAVDRNCERESFIAAIHEGLADSAAGRLLDDEMLDAELDRLL